MTLSALTCVGAVPLVQTAYAQETELDRALAFEEELSNELMELIEIAAPGPDVDEPEAEGEDPEKACFEKYRRQRENAHTLFELCLEDVGYAMQFLEAEIRLQCKEGALPKTSCTEEAIKHALGQYFSALRNECRAEYRDDLKNARNRLRQCLNDAVESTNPSESQPTQNPSGGGLGS